MSMVVTENVCVQALASEIAVREDLLIRVSGGNLDGSFVRISQSRFTIGADPSSDLHLTELGVQSLQCTIQRGPRGAVARCGSPNTRLNGLPFSVASLRVGDRIEFGPIGLEVVDPESERQAVVATPTESDVPSCEERPSCATTTRIDPFSRALQSLQVARGGAAFTPTESSSVAESRKVLEETELQLRQIRRERDDFEAELLQTSEDLTRLSSQIRRTTEENEELREASNRAVKTCEQLQARVEELTQETSDLQTLTSQFAQEREELRERLRAAKDELSQLRSHMSNGIQELNELRSVLEQERLRYDAERQVLHGQMRDLVQQFEATRSEGETLRDELSGLRASAALDLENSRAQLTAIEIDRTRLDLQNKQLAEAAEKLLVEKQNLEVTVQNLDAERQRLAQAHHDLQSEVQDLKAKFPTPTSIEPPPPLGRDELAKSSCEEPSCEEPSCEEPNSHEFSCSAKAETNSIEQTEPSQPKSGIETLSHAVDSAPAPVETADAGGEDRDNESPSRTDTSINSSSEEAVAGEAVAGKAVEVEVASLPESSVAASEPATPQFVSEVLPQEILTLADEIDSPSRSSSELTPTLNNEQLRDATATDRESLDPTSFGPTSFGPESTGPESTGPESTGPESTGPESTGPESIGPESIGPESIGPESIGPESIGPESTVLEQPEPESKGPESVHPEAIVLEEAVSPELPGHSAIRPLPTSPEPAMADGIDVARGLGPVAVIPSKCEQEPQVQLEPQMDSPEVLTALARERGELAEPKELVEPTPFGEAALSLDRLGGLSSSLRHLTIPPEVAEGDHEREGSFVPQAPVIQPYSLGSVDSSRRLSPSIPQAPVTLFRPQENDSQPASFRASRSPDEEDDSIEQYMNKLMARVRGDRPYEPATFAPTPPTTTKVEETSTTPTPLEIATREEPELIDLASLPRRRAPELSANLSVMRELANNEANSAIQRSAKKVRQDANRSKGILAGASLIGAGGVIYVGRNNPMLLIAGSVFGIAAIFWLIVEIARQARYSLNLNNAAAEAEKTIGAEPVALDDDVIDPIVD